MVEYYEVLRGFENYADGEIVPGDCFPEYELQSWLAQGHLAPFVGDGFAADLAEELEDIEPEMLDELTEAAIDATVTAWERAGELGVDLSEVEGTGSGGRVTVRDVERYADES